MYCVSYGPAFSGGSLTVPPSKSAAIRALLCGALSRHTSGRECKIENLYPSDDITVTKRAHKNGLFCQRCFPSQRKLFSD